MAKSKKSKSSAPKTKKSSAPKTKKSSSKSKAKSKSAPAQSKPVSAALPVVAGAAIVLLGVALLWPRSASAATLPAPRTPVSSRPIPARTPATRAKPMISSALRTQINALAESPLYFWIQAAVHTLNSATPAPTEARLQSMNSTRTYDSATASGLQRLGSASRSGSPVAYDDFQLLFDRMKGRRINLPYQVPTDVWQRVQAVLKDVLGAPDDEATDEPV